jgi:hypothetical protein
MGGSLSGAARCMCSKLEKVLKLTFLRLVHFIVLVGQDIDAGHFFKHGMVHNDNLSLLRQSK